jgi:hypothetical protein
MHAESEARVAAVAADMGTSSTGSVSQELPTSDEMEDVKTQDSPLSVLSTAASSGVLHLVRQ